MNSQKQIKACITIAVVVVIGAAIFALVSCQSRDSTDWGAISRETGRIVNGDRK